ncbi:type II restriction enzyme [Pseudoleptotrichia goodfellowii]|uniref:Type II restriction endonuclease n=1 Tax=Pseudoleptotrichia goodfellowii TaxID=157692 RepID=A0A510J7N2_9FUSO|nr:hypothetical protein [Pseudoleptotrichia goodfellowii]BBM35228.1 hypothetical protein JCM16774_0135 [Pseudoleptotrichia goodfellowii]
MIKNNYTANEAWKELINKYNILEEIKKKGFYNIKAEQIKEFKEPRLMAKWDSSASLPSVLQDNKINMLPDSRNSYIIGNFSLYEKLPELKESVTKMAKIEVPEYETIDINNITSEANAINILAISGILEDFLNTSQNVMTFNGRMGTGIFNFKVNTFKNIKQKVEVNNAQCEIDGGFENENSVIIMEAKNVIHEDFHIRQLYYPYRLWKNRVSKPIRLVFSIYSNKIYRLFEYRFNNFEDYSSIELVNSKNYSLQDTEITIEDLKKVKSKLQIKTDDNKNDVKTPFVQADSMDRVVSLLENLYENPMTKFEIAELMNFEERQSDYYFNAGKYLGLFEKGENKLRKLTTLGNKIFKLSYKERQLKLVELILEHRIFNELFDTIIKTGEFPDKEEVMNKMYKLNICESRETISRRAGSVLGWLKWIFELTRLNYK